MGSKGAWLTSAVGLTSVGVGLVIGAPYMIATGVVAAGVIGIAAIAEDIRIEKQRKMFKACDICIKKDDSYYYPSIISSGEDYILVDLPSGMGIKEVTNKHSAIENYYGRKVLIEQTYNRKVLIKLLSPRVDEEDRWLDIFSKLGLVGPVGEYPSMVDSEINKIGQKVVFKLPAGMIVSDFEKKLDELESAIKYKMEISSEKYKLVIQTITREFKKLYKIDFRKHVTKDMRFLLGIGRDGEPLAVDLGGNEFSTLVVGASGSGKSAFLNCLMIQFILKGIEIYAIDLKAVEFNIYKHYKNMTRYAVTKEDAVKILGAAQDLMNERYKELEEKNCKSYVDYNKKFNNTMPPVLVIIDEFSVFMEGKKDSAYKFLFNLLSRCRAANILMIICTQTPRAEILPGTVRCNIKNTICFSVETDTDSEVALGQRGNYRAARELSDAGRGFLKSGGKFTEFQGYFLEDDEIDQQIKGQVVAKSGNEGVRGKANQEKVIPIKKKGKKAQDVGKLMDKIDSM